MAGTSSKVIFVAFIMNMGIAIAKFIGFFFTNSGAMLAEAIHSLADTSNQVFLYLGTKMSKKAPTESHPFGFGKEQYIWSFLVALLIFALGSLFSFYEGIHKLIEPGEISNTGISLVILGVAILLETYSTIVAVKEFNLQRGSISTMKYIKESKDQVLITVLFEDFAALFGLIIAFIGIVLTAITHNPMFDSLATIAIGVLLAVVAVFLFKEARSLLVGEGANEEERNIIKEIINSHETVESMKEMLTLYFRSDQLLINAHVKFKVGMDLKEVEEAIDDIEDKISDRIPHVFKIFIETHQKETVSSFSKKRSDDSDKN